MYKISLLDINDLEEAYEIEVLTNPSPWSIDNFKSSFEVGHHGLVCKEDNKMLGFLIFSPIKPEPVALHFSKLLKKHHNLCCPFLTYKDFPSDYYFYLIKNKIYTELKKISS